MRWRPGASPFSGPYRPYLEHPAPQPAGRPAGADAGVSGPGARRHPPTGGLLLAPPAPWHRPTGTPVSEPLACSSSGRYSPLAERARVPPRPRPGAGIRGLRPEDPRRTPAPRGQRGGARRRPGDGLRARDLRRGALGGDGDRAQERPAPALAAGRGTPMSVATLVLSLADCKHLLGLRYAEWATRAPSLEADIA